MERTRILSRYANASSNADETDHSISKKYFQAWHLKKGMKKIGGKAENDGKDSEVLIQKEDDKKITRDKKNKRKYKLVKSKNTACSDV